MSIDPNLINTARVGELPIGAVSLTDKIAHEISSELKQATVQELADVIGAYLGTTSGLAFNPITVSDGQTLPTTTSNEWILVGKGTFPNVGGGATITTTEELNALVSNGSTWSVGVEIPVNVELAGIVQTIREGYTQTTPSEDKVFKALQLKADSLTYDNVTNAIGYTPADASNKQNSLATDGTGIKFPTVDAVNLTLTTKADLVGGLVPISQLQNATNVIETQVFAPKEAVFAFHFDGGYINNFTGLLDKAEQLGVKVGIGAIKSLTNGSYGGTNQSANFGYNTDYIDAYKRGHEIYNHGASDSLNLAPGTNVSANVQEYWINDSHKWLESLGINAQIWVTSNGAPITNQTPHLDPKYIPKILEKHSVVLGRTSSIGNDVNGFLGTSYGADTLVNKVGLTRANVEGQSQASINAFIDYCIENKRVAILHAHDSANPLFDVTDFETTVNYIKSKGAKVVTGQEVFASFTNLFSDGATSSKAANAASLQSMTAFNENLLNTTDLTKFTALKQAGIGTYVFTSYGDDRQQGEQFGLAIANPTIINSTLELRQIINRPFNVMDVETICATVEFSSSNIADFGVACKIQFYTGVDGTGTLIKEFSEGATQSLSGIIQTISSKSANLFAYSNVQSLQVIYEIANKTIWTGAKTITLYNPRLNRGSLPSAFIKKRTQGTPNLYEIKTFSGNIKGVGGQLTLSVPVNKAHFIKIEVGVNNTNNDVRGSAICVYNTSELITARAFGGTTGAIYTDFTLRFNNPTQLEIINRVDVGGGDFAVLGVYIY